MALGRTRAVISTVHVPRRGHVAPRLVLLELRIRQPRASRVAREIAAQRAFSLPPSPSLSHSPVRPPGGEHWTLDNPGRGAPSVSERTPCHDVQRAYGRTADVRTPSSGSRECRAYGCQEGKEALPSSVGRYQAHLRCGCSVFGCSPDAHISPSRHSVPLCVCQ